MRIILDIIRAIFRILATMGMLTAFFAVGLLINAVASGYSKLSEPLGKVWYEDDVLQPILGTPSIQLFQVFFERKLGLAFVWDPVITTILNWPTWLALGGGAVACVIVSMLIFGFTKVRGDENTLHDIEV